MSNPTGMTVPTKADNWHAHKKCFAGRGRTLVRKGIEGYIELIVGLKMCLERGSMGPKLYPRDLYTRGRQHLPHTLLNDFRAIRFIFQEQLSLRMRFKRLGPNLKKSLIYLRRRIKRAKGQLGSLLCVGRLRIRVPDRRGSRSLHAQCFSASPSRTFGITMRVHQPYIDLRKTCRIGITQITHLFTRQPSSHQRVTGYGRCAH